LGGVDLPRVVGNQLRLKLTAPAVKSSRAGVAGEVWCNDSRSPPAPLRRAIRSAAGRREQGPTRDEAVPLAAPVVAGTVPLVALPSPSRPSRVIRTPHRELVLLAPATN
jgi:hypothetical protein